MKKLKHFLTEAKAGRAWSGKIEKIDKLMSWLYDKDILTAKEKKKKDSVFSQYYRFYNDGDFPRALTAKGLSKYSPQDKIETALEEVLDEYIKTILAKYLPKINRTEFRYDTILGDLYTLKDIIDRDDFYGLVTYWGPKAQLDDENFNNSVAELHKKYFEFRKKVDDFLTTLDDNKYGKNSWDKPSANTTLSFVRDRLKEKGDWSKEFEKEYHGLQDINRQIGYRVNDIIVATQRAKDALNESCFSIIE